MSLNKSRLYETLAVQAGLSKNRSSQAVGTIIDALKLALSNGETVRISGFGKFYTQTISEHTGRHPKTGMDLKIPTRRTVRFKSFKKLRHKINNRPTAVHAIPQASERRREPRMHALPQGTGILRISGIAVCDFKVRDVSGNGSCILIEDDSVVLRNLHVGREIELHWAYADDRNKAVLQRSRITHITSPTDGETYRGHVMVGVQIIDSIDVH